MLQQLASAVYLGEATLRAATWAQRNMGSVRVHALRPPRHDPTLVDLALRLV